jgi:hypothetical protein
MFWFVTAFGIPEPLIELSVRALDEAPKFPNQNRLPIREGSSEVAHVSTKHTSSANEHGVVSHSRHRILLILIQNNNRNVCFNWDRGLESPSCRYSPLGCVLLF